MGSKAALLAGELGELILESTEDSERFVDLFSGSGAVSHWVAEVKSIPVISVDVQEYARLLAACVTERTTDISRDKMLAAWVSQERVGSDNARDSSANSERLNAENVGIARLRSESGIGFIERSYGGHYYSPRQARALDSLYNSIPMMEPQRTVALAALIQVASVCAASPGHTAQPFQPTRSLLPYIEAAWARDVLSEVRRALATISPRHALAQGTARVGNALEVANELQDGDFVFCDPPYSAVQYSRFYHVLEGIAVGGWPEVAGAGRAPARAIRHASAFSMRSKSARAMKELLDVLNKRDLRVMITFPNDEASNGLSGVDIQKMAFEDWHVRVHHLDSTHSTLGGRNGKGGRGGRRELKEAVILLEPKANAVSPTPPKIQSEAKSPAPLDSDEIVRRDYRNAAS